MRESEDTIWNKRTELSIKDKELEAMEGKSNAAIEFLKYQRSLMLVEQIEFFLNLSRGLGIFNNLGTEVR